MLIQNNSLKPGESLALVWVPLNNGTQRAETRYSRVRARLKQPCDAANVAATDASYLVDGSNLENGKIYFAVARKQANFDLRQGQVEGRLGSSAVAFSACASTEGVHLNVWMGKAHTGKKLWHRYYYLGYDVEPTCTEADFKE
nr:L810 [uncultured bacterium]